jgi:hypothetical protein
LLPRAGKCHFLSVHRLNVVGVHVHQLVGRQRRPHLRPDARKERIEIRTPQIPGAGKAKDPAQIAVSQPMPAMATPLHRSVIRLKDFILKTALES